MSSPSPTLDGILTLALPAPTPSPPPPSSSSLPPPRKSFPSPCWSHHETLALIEAYRSKWLSLQKGNLRAPHWQDVADAVSQVCPLPIPKTSVQCRHKIEKLRKRYRVERQRSLRLHPHSPPSSPWPFFAHMESVDPNPTPPLPNPAPPSEDSSDSSDSSSHYPARIPNGGGGLGFRIPTFERPRNVNPPVAEGEKRKRDGCEIAAAVRMLGDGFMRMEQMKMDMTREFEKVRMEMEIRRTQMILESNRRIVDAFLKGIVGKKRRQS